jgi:hypothetical protein
MNHTLIQITQEMVDERMKAFLERNNIYPCKLFRLEEIPEKIYSLDFEYNLKIENAKIGPIYEHSSIYRGFIAGEYTIIPVDDEEFNANLAS